MDHVGLGDVLEQLAIQVRDAALAGGSVAVLARVGLQQRDELLQRLGRHLRIYRQHVGHVDQVGDRCEILERVVRILGVGGRVGRHGADRGDAEGVAIRRGLGQRIGADRAAAAAAVFHHHRLAQLAAQAVGDRARDDVGGAAGRERDDQADRLGGVGLRLGNAGTGQADGCDAGGCACFVDCFQGCLRSSFTDCLPGGLQAFLSGATHRAPRAVSLPARADPAAPGCGSGLRIAMVPRYGTMFHNVRGSDSTGKAGEKELVTTRVSRKWQSCRAPGRGLRRRA
ncbi:hypothetical protein D9M68_671870 [compost metagenome]